MFKFAENDNKIFCIKDSNAELSATFEVLPKDLDTITIEWWVNFCLSMLTWSGCSTKLSTSIMNTPQNNKNFPSKRVKNSIKVQGDKTNSSPVRSRKWQKSVVEIS